MLNLKPKKLTNKGFLLNFFVKSGCDNQQLEIAPNIAGPATEIESPLSVNEQVLFLQV